MSYFGNGAGVSLPSIPTFTRKFRPERTCGRASPGRHYVLGANAGATTHKHLILHTYMTNVGPRGSATRKGPNAGATHRNRLENSMPCSGTLLRCARDVGTACQRPYRQRCLEKRATTISTGNRWYSVPSHLRPTDTL